MGTYLVRLYSPHTLKTFALRVDAATVEEAKRKVLYHRIKKPDGTVELVPKTITDPDGYEFEAEEHFIISIAPIKAIPLPPYELMDEEEVKEAEWLKSAHITEPLPKGAAPVGSPKLAGVIPNGITTMLYAQEVRSRAIRFKEHYPEFTIAGVKYGPYKPGDVEYRLPWSKARELTATKYRVLKSPPLMPLIDPKGKVLHEPLTGEAYEKEKAKLDELLKAGKIKKETYEKKLEELRGEYTYSEPEELAWAERQVLEGKLQRVTEPPAEWLYPEVKVKIHYRRDVFTKFYEEAKRMAKARKIREAVLYLVETSPGITIRQIADILEIGYWTAYRFVKSWVSPAAAKVIEKEAEEQATLEMWLPEQLEEFRRQPPTTEPKIVIGPMWRGMVTLYPAKWKTEEELLKELNRILTLEGLPKLTPEEEEEMRRQLRQYWEKKAREKITYYVK